MVGDGELQEGQVWEAAMSAAHYKLDNLVIYVDNNKMETDGLTSKIMNVEPIAEKFSRFWVQRVRRERARLCRDS